MDKSGENNKSHLYVMIHNTYNVHNINIKRINQDKLKTVSGFINKKISYKIKL